MFNDPPSVQFPKPMFSYPNQSKRLSEATEQLVLHSIVYLHYNALQYHNPLQYNALQCPAIYQEYAIMCIVEPSVVYRRKRIIQGSIAIQLEVQVSAKG